MAAPETLDLTITRGDTETVIVELYADEAGTTPINITGRTYSSQIRTSPDSSVISATLTCTVTNGASGEVTCVLAPSASAALTPGYYTWDLQENASGTITTVVSGTVTVLADTTR